MSQRGRPTIRRRFFQTVHPRFRKKISFRVPGVNNIIDLQENKNDIVGNKTLHCGKLMDMFKKFYKEHGQNEPRCELLCNWNTNNCQKWGLSWRLRLKCDNCNFCGEKTKVYTEAWNYLHVAVLNLDVKY